MRKSLLLVIAVSAFWFACDTNDSPTYTINAEITGPENLTKIYLQVVENDQLKTIDSSFLDNSRVKFEGHLDKPEMIYLRIGDSKQMINVFAENSKISIKVSTENLDQAVVKGSSVHDDLMSFKKHLEFFDEKAKELNEQYRISDAKDQKEIVNEYESLRLEQTEAIKNFVSNKPKSYLSPFIIARYLLINSDYVELKNMVEGLDSVVYDSEEYKMLSERVNRLEKVAVGMPAVDFALNDTTGNPIAISSFRGKYLLIDFWASWCAPCRKENPNVVKLYNDFNDKGFEIIGVSFDEDRDRWIGAIHQDGLAWPHVSDLRGFQSTAGQLYVINAIPATVLLDREGNIVAKNLRGDALREKLEELYAKEAQNS